MRNKVLGIVFLCIIIIVPGITVISRVCSGEATTVSEEKTNNIFMAVDVFLEDIPVRKTMAGFNAKLTRKITGSGYINSTQVILGKNDWLYFKETIADYEHGNCFNEDEKASILDKLVSQQEFLAEKGIELVIYIPPNKATIYPENMPDTIIQPADTESRVEDLIAYIRANSDIKVIYPKDELIQAKKIAPVYYWSDTHWNEVGGYVGTQVFLREVFDFEDRFQADMISVREEYRFGDLAKLCGITDIYREYIMYGVSVSELNDEWHTDKRVYFIGDSFRESMEAYLKYYIDNISVIHNDELYYPEMMEFKPDIIVWEIVERNVNKYLVADIIDEEAGTANNGFVKKEGKWYYFDENGQMIKNAWVETEAHAWYYMTEDGSMLTDAYTPDGYYVNEHGQWIQ